MSFASHRNTDCPASAVQAGASTLPAAWRVNPAAGVAASTRYDQPVRSIPDIMADPFRWLRATALRKSVTAATCVLLLVVIFF